jgi:hypothetical protein
VYSRDTGRGNSREGGGLLACLDSAVLEARPNAEARALEPRAELLLGRLDPYPLQLREVAFERQEARLELLVRERLHLREGRGVSD